MMNTPQVPDKVKLRLYLPKGDPVLVMARTRWSRELAPGRYHIGFEMFSFREPSHERRLIHHLNALTNEASELDFTALRDLTDDEKEGMAVVLAAGRAFNSSQGYDQALDRVLKVTCEALGAERGLFLLNRGGPVPSVEAARGPEAISQRGLAFSETVVQNVLASGEPLLSMDVQTDVDLGDAASLQVMGTLSVLCVPLQSRGRNFGLLYLDSSITKGAFQEADLALATVIADLAASCIERLHYFYQALQREKLAAVTTLVSGLVRELVDPLGTLRALGERRLRGMEEPEDAGKIVRASDRAIDLVTRLLRLKEGTSEPQVDVDLKEVLTRVHDTAAPSMTSAGIDFKVLSQAELPVVSGHEDQLVQVLLNLLNNAAEAVGSRAKKTIRVSTAVTPDTVRISVADDGPGVPPNDLKRIFDPFVTTKKDSHGLGLALIQSLVQQHNGVIAAHNRPSGGAIFSLELPRKDEA